MNKLRYIIRDRRYLYMKYLWNKSGMENWDYYYYCTNEYVFRGK